MQLVALACLAARASALTVLWPMLAVPRSHSRVHMQRSRNLFAQLAPGWVTGIDEASGMTYYYNEQTGQSQWEPPEAGTAQQGYDQQDYALQQQQWQPSLGGSGRFLLRLVPVTGARSPIRRGGKANLAGGDEQIIGRFDMVDQDVYVSRKQCILQVAADGTATLTSLGKPPTLVRGRDGGPWYGLRKDETHVLSDGAEICLTGKAPNILAGQAVGQDFFNTGPQAVFICECRQGEGGGGMSGNNDVVQYSEDGCWMWNGVEWIPAQ